jgi:hypothetical protein
VAVVTLIKDSINFHWWQHPNAVHYVGTKDQTYIAWTTRGGHLRIGSFNHTTRLWRTNTLALNYKIPMDDHMAPTIYVRTDGRLLVFSTDHDGPIHSWKSTNPEDITSFGVQTEIDSGQNAYPKPVLCGSRLVLFYRKQVVSEGRPHHYRISTDDGDTWGSEVKFLANSTQRPYVQVVGNGADRVDISFTQGYPSEVATCSMYHCYFTPSDGKFYKSDGTEITNLPLDHSAATLVYSGATNEAWGWDVQIRSGNPEILFEQIVNAASDYRIRHASWNGSAWSDREVATIGSRFAAGGANTAEYTGGACFDPSDLNTCYLADEVSSGVWEIEKFTYNGTSWSYDSTVSGTGGVRFRPVVVRNPHASELRAFWNNATSPLHYTNTDNFNTDLEAIMDLPPWGFFMFIIPNEVGAGDAKQSAFDQHDFTIIAEAARGNGVISGCAVTAQGTPDMTVAVAVGLVQNGSTTLAVTAGNVTVGAADGSNPRFDLIVADSTGAKQCRAGTAAASPVFPTPSAGDIVLAAIFVPTSDTDIDSNQIVDKRMFVTGCVQLTKGSDQTVNSAGTGTTLVDATGLSFPADANGEWQIQATIFYDSGTTPDFKIAMDAPTGSTGRVSVLGLDTAATAVSGDIRVATTVTVVSATGIARGGAGAGNSISLFLSAVIQVGGTAGTIKVRFAQQVADAGDTKMLANSHLEAIRKSGMAGS